MQAKAKHLAVRMIDHTYWPRFVYPAYQRYVFIKYRCTDYYFEKYIFTFNHN